jgi:hypothetical protein
MRPLERSRAVKPSAQPTQVQVLHLPHQLFPAQRPYGASFALQGQSSQTPPRAAVCRWSRNKRAMILSAFPQVGMHVSPLARARTSPRNAEGPRTASGTLLVRLAPSHRQGVIDPPVRDLPLTVDALRVDPQQDIHAVSRPFGHVGSGNARVQPALPGRSFTIAGRNVESASERLSRLLAAACGYFISM